MILLLLVAGLRWRSTGAYASLHRNPMSYDTALLIFSSFQSKFAAILAACKCFVKPDHHLNAVG
jgi:hypothetical protein